MENNFWRWKKRLKILKVITAKKIKECEVLAQKAIEHADETRIKKRYQLFLDSCKNLENEQHLFSNTLKEFGQNLESGNISNIENKKEVLHQELSSDG